MLYDEHVPVQLLSNGYDKASSYTVYDPIHHSSSESKVDDWTHEMYSFHPHPHPPHIKGGMESVHIHK